MQALDRVSRYTGAPAETAPWHKLGGEAWGKAKRKAAQRVRDVAAELLDLYARRAARQGEALPLKEAEYAAFAAAFPFEETHQTGRLSDWFPAYRQRYYQVMSNPITILLRVEGPMQTNRFYPPDNGLK